MKETMERLQFPREAEDLFLSLKAGMTAQDTAFYEALRHRWMTEARDDGENKRVYDELALWAEGKGIHPYTAHMLMLLWCAPALREKYAAAGLSEERYWDILGDVAIKLRECREVCGIWGTMTFQWFQRHYTLSIFGLGRLQFEPRTLDTEIFTLGDCTIRRGDKVYGIHIPSSGKLTEEKLLASFRMAYDFFGFRDGEIMPVDCWSWLLWPGHENIYPTGGNLMAFLHSFRILNSVEHEAAFPDAWRVFGKEDCSDLDSLPTDTALRRNILSYLRTGGKIGSGYGVLLFDGEKVLTKHD